MEQSRQSSENNRFKKVNIIFILQNPEIIRMLIRPRDKLRMPIRITDGRLFMPQEAEQACLPGGIGVESGSFDAIMF